MLLYNEDQNIPSKYKGINITYLNETLQPEFDFDMALVSLHLQGGTIYAKTNGIAAQKIIKLMTDIWDPSDVKEHTSPHEYKADLIVGNCVYQGCWPSSVEMDWRTATKKKQKDVIYNITFEFDNKVFRSDI